MTTPTRKIAEDLAKHHWGIAKYFWDHNQHQINGGWFGGEIIFHIRAVLLILKAYGKPAIKQEAADLLYAMKPRVVVNKLLGRKK